MGQAGSGDCLERNGNADRILFWLMTLSACSYAAILGGWEGKWTTALILSATAGTFVSETVVRLAWHSTNSLVFLVDVALFVGMYLVAVKSRRWWPLWVAAFQLNSIAAHLATVLSPTFSAAVYNGFEGIWAFSRPDPHGLRHLARPHRPVPV